jgi:sortase B
MLIKALRIVRLGTRLAWFIAAAGVITLALLPHVLALAGHEMLVVKGSSMEPTVPLGSVIFIRPVDPSKIAVGNIITFRAPNGVTVSHRVVGLAEGSSLAFQTKGDGSSAADPVIVPATSVEGVVESFIPDLGYLISTLGSTAGAVAMVALIAGLLLWSWFLDELIATTSRSTQGRLAAAEPAF